MLSKLWVSAGNPPSALQGIRIGDLIFSCNKRGAVKVTVTLKLLLTERFLNKISLPKYVKENQDIVS